MKNFLQKTREITDIDTPSAGIITCWAPFDGSLEEIHIKVASVGGSISFLAKANGVTIDEVAIDAGDNVEGVIAVFPPIAVLRGQPLRLDVVTMSKRTFAPITVTWKLEDGLSPSRIPECIPVIVSDEITAITAGTSKRTFRIPYPLGFTVTDVSGSLTTASTSGLVTVDINENGTSILSTELTFDATEKTSETAATAEVISDTFLAFDSEITVDIDAAGTGAKGLKVYILGYQGI